MAEFDELDTSQVIQNLLNPQSQSGAGQSPGVLEMLTSLLGPGEAQAASAPDPWTRQFKELQMRNQQKLQQQQLQQRQQQIDLSREKQQAKTAPREDITTGLTRILGGGQPQASVGGAPIFSGITPGTGTPYFGDKPPSFATAPEREMFEEKQAAFQAKQPKAKPAAPGQIEPERLAKSAELAKMLKDNGYPAETVNLVLRNTFPELAEQKAKEKQSFSDITQKRQQAMADYNAKISEAKELNKPLPPATQAQLGYLKDLQSRADTIASFVDTGKHKEIVGPVQGASYRYRRMLPGGATPDEVAMFQAVEDAQDLLLRKRSGAAINEAEATRVAGLLPKPTDDPDTFAAAFNVFQKNLADSIANGKLFAGMTRGELREQGISGPKQPAAAANAPAASAGWKTGPGGVKYRLKGKTSAQPEGAY